jgi:hypothetical protein
MQNAPKRLTTQVPQVDICELRRNGFVPGVWTYRQGDVVTIHWHGIVSNVYLVSTAMHLGGRREWFSCPCCGGRARVLYGPEFACRSCQCLNYPSTRQCMRDRAITRAVQLRRRFGGSGSSDPYEMEADSFAAGLLMPEDLFKAALKKRDTDLATIEHMASLHHSHGDPLQRNGQRRRGHRDQHRPNGRLLPPFRSYESPAQAQLD